jgi:hypothetical protein
MNWKALITNGHEKCESTYLESKNYVSANAAIDETINVHLRAYNEIGDLIPQTLDNFASGHYFPYSQSYFELENSCELAMQGFYTYAFSALRTVLELGFLSIYFAAHDQEHIDVQAWINAQEKTPTRKQIFSRLKEIPAFYLFDVKFDFTKRIFKTFDDLDRYVHTRGSHHSSTALNSANYNRFSEKSFKLYCKLMTTVVNSNICVFLMKYPIGMHGLPLDEKYGLNGPVGGFLREEQVSLIASLLSQEEKDMLIQISNEDQNVQKCVEHINQLPDLTPEEWESQENRIEAEKAGMKYSIYIATDKT